MDIPLTILFQLVLGGLAYCEKLESAYSINLHMVLNGSSVKYYSKISKVYSKK